MVLSFVQLAAMISNVLMILCKSFIVKKNAPKWSVFFYDKIFYSIIEIVSINKTIHCNTADCLFKVTSKGFEPPTLGAEIRYSIQLNYEAILCLSVLEW